MSRLRSSRRARELKCNEYRISDFGLYVSFYHIYFGQQTDYAGFT